MNNRRHHNRPARLVELPLERNGTTRAVTGASGLIWREFAVSAWSLQSGGSPGPAEYDGLYYYELVHSKARYTVPIELYYKVRNAYIAPEHLVPKTGSERSSLLIYLTFQPSADQIIIGFG